MAAVTAIPALLLGGVAYAAQIIVVLLLTLPRTWRGHRKRLALAQHNGMTAIVLALKTASRHTAGELVIIEDPDPKLNLACTCASTHLTTRFAAS